MVLRALDQFAEGVGPPGFDELVGVLGPLHLQNADPEVQAAEDADGPLGGLLPRAVAVVGDHHIVGIAGDQPGLFGGQARPQGGHGAVKAGLVQRYYIYIALCKQNISIFAFFGQI